MLTRAATEAVAAYTACNEMGQARPPCAWCCVSSACMILQASSTFHCSTCPLSPAGYPSAGRRCTPGRPPGRRRHGTAEPGARLRDGLSAAPPACPAPCPPGQSPAGRRPGCLQPQQLRQPLAPAGERRIEEFTSYTCRTGETHRDTHPLIRCHPRQPGEALSGARQRVGGGHSVGVVVSQAISGAVAWRRHLLPRVPHAQRRRRQGHGAPQLRAVLHAAQLNAIVPVLLVCPVAAAVCIRWLSVWESGESQTPGGVCVRQTRRGRNSSRRRSCLRAKIASSGSHAPASLYSNATAWDRSQRRAGRRGWGGRGHPVAAKYWADGGLTGCEPGGSG